MDEKIQHNQVKDSEEIIRVNMAISEKTNDILSDAALELNKVFNIKTTKEEIMNTLLEFRIHNAVAIYRELRS